MLALSGLFFLLMFLFLSAIGFTIYDLKFVTGRSEENKEYERRFIWAALICSSVFGILGGWTLRTSTIQTLTLEAQQWANHTHQGQAFVDKRGQQYQHEIMPRDPVLAKDIQSTTFVYPVIQITPGGLNAQMLNILVKQDKQSQIISLDASHVTFSKHYAPTKPRVVVIDGKEVLEYDQSVISGYTHVVVKNTNQST